MPGCVQVESSTEVSTVPGQAEIYPELPKESWKMVR